MTTLDRYDHLPEPFRAPLLELEMFIGEMDGKTIGQMTAEDDAFIDEGTVDADDAVKAFNAIVAALPCWQPIETAPKAGWFLTYVPPGPYQGMAVNRREGDGWWKSCLENPPTLWMPLLPVPQAEVALTAGEGDK